MKDEEWKDESSKDGKKGNAWSASEEYVKDRFIIELTIFKIVSIGGEFGLMTCRFVESCVPFTLVAERV